MSTGSLIGRCPGVALGYRGYRGTFITLIEWGEGSPRLSLDQGYSIARPILTKLLYMGFWVDIAEWEHMISVGMRRYRFEIKVEDHRGYDTWEIIDYITQQCQAIRELRQ